WRRTTLPRSAPTSTSSAKPNAPFSRTTATWQRMRRSSRPYVTENALTRKNPIREVANLRKNSRRENFRSSFAISPTLGRHSSRRIQAGSRARKPSVSSRRRCSKTTHARTSVEQQHGLVTARPLEDAIQVLEVSLFALPRHRECHFRDGRGERGIVAVRFNSAQAKAGHEGRQRDRWRKASRAAGVTSAPYPGNT